MWEWVGLGGVISVGLWALYKWGAAKWKERNRHKMEQLADAIEMGTKREESTAALTQTRQRGVGSYLARIRARRLRRALVQDKVRPSGEADPPSNTT